MPSSSTQALIGALAGAGLAAGGRVEWAALRRSVVAPMLVSPVVGFLGAWLLMVLLTRYLEDAAHERALRGFRMAQSVTAATVSVGHGLQDAQKTIGAVMIALGSATGLGADGPEAPGPSVPWWLRLSVALALGLGTYAGGWRIIRTLARRLVRITPVSGFAANGVASAVLYAAGGVLGAPVSTTMVVTSAVVGAAVTDGLKVVRWATARAVLLTWVLTPLATFAAAEALMALLIAVT
jgi:PiT family inorganic phosphate transporter